MADVKPASWKPLVVRGTPRSTVYRESNIDLPEYAIVPRQPRGRLTHFVPWGDSRDFALQVHKDYLGFTTVVNSPHSGKYYSRTIPWEHPCCPNYLFAESLPQMVADVPRGKDDVGVGKGDEAKVTVQLGTFPYRILTDEELAALAVARGGANVADESTLLRYVSVRYSTAARYEMVPSTSPLVWQGQNNDPVAVRRPVLFVEGDLRIKHFSIPLESIPRTAISRLIGKTSILWPNAGFVAGSMLANYFDVANPNIVKDRLVMQLPTIGEPYFMANGEMAVDLEFWWKFYPNGANRMYRWDARPAFGPPGFYDVGFTGGVLLFPRVPTFNDLFQPEP